MILIVATAVEVESFQLVLKSANLAYFVLCQLITGFHALIVIVIVLYC